jgi:hypothetical protein
MNAILRNIAGVLIGLVVGGSVNMGLILLGPSFIPPPPGVDVTDFESLSASMHLFEARHFVFPFVAHALGTLVGSIVAFVIAATHRTQIVFIIGAAFFAGGISASLMIPAPKWFVAVDLMLAYFPMAWIGQRLAARFLCGQELQATSKSDT